MHVVYTDTIEEKIERAILDARRYGRHIDHVILNDSEWLEADRAFSAELSNGQSTATGHMTVRIASAHKVTLRREGWA